MNFVRSRAFWLSFAVGSAIGVMVVRTRTHRVSRRVVNDGTERVAWHFDNRFRTLPAGSSLRVQTNSEAVVHWTATMWDHVEDTRTTEIAPGVHVADLATESLTPGTRVQFTFYWPRVNRWEGEDFELRIEPAEAARQAGDAE